MDLPIPLTLRPMEAQNADDLPAGERWVFEPKYDGFRCLAFRDGADVVLMSKNQKPLGRYFPEVARALRGVLAERIVLDGEIRLADPNFETQQLRLHPAGSRVKRLSIEKPAQLIIFDLLLDAAGRNLTKAPFAERRAHLESAFEAGGGLVDPGETLQLGESTPLREIAMGWLGRPGIDGVMAKDLTLPYRAGKRAMIKHKTWTTLDCVVGGLHLARSRDAVEAFLLGLYDDAGKLHYVGRAPITRDHHGIHELLSPLIGGTGFTGRRPERRDRWTGVERRPVPLEHRVVVEAASDLVSAGFMRHGARILRIRNDKSPRDCTIDQIAA